MTQPAAARNILTTLFERNRDVPPARGPQATDMVRQ